MKIIVNIIRFLVGALFIFSGFVKFNDPIGFSYKMEEYFEVFSDDLNTAQDSLNISINDQRGNVVYEKFPTYKFKTESSVWIITETEDEPMDLGGEEFIVTNVSISVDNEIIFDEMYTYKPGSELSDSIWIDWALGEDLVNHYTEAVSYRENLENNITLDYTNELKSQPVLSKFFDNLIPFALWIGMFICVFELVVGFMLILGWESLLTILIMVMMIIFFTFLTGYSAVFNKVTDCGCFGDAIPLTPWQSFYKDIVLSILLLILLIGHKHIKSLFSNKFSKKAVLASAVLAFGYSIYAYTHLPPINFLNFANGNNIYERTLIPEGELKDNQVEIAYYYKNNQTGEEKEFDINTAPIDDDNWTFIDRKDKLIKKAYKPKLDTFHDIIGPNQNDVADSILLSDEYQLIIASYDIQLSSNKGMQKAIKLGNEWVKNQNANVWFITSNTKDELDEFASLNKIDFNFYSADNKFVKSIIRSNPGVILMKGPVIIQNWHSGNIPNYESISKKLK